MAHARRFPAFVLAMLVCCPGAAIAQTNTQAGQSARSVSQLSLEELGDMEVTTVSKTPEMLRRTTAAIYVITQEDIRRSGATALPDILRLAPGVQVARIDSDHWAVGIRGFGDQFSKSVLVLVDGRNLYTPLFAGIYWGAQDTLLEDIERIEVIRGPGGTVWGANAVNGVINIITKNASETSGVLVSGLTGNVDRGRAGFRFGGNNRGAFGYRVYGKAFNRDAEFHTNGRDFDAWRMRQAGFRADWGGTVDNLTVQGDVYRANEGQSVAFGSFSPLADITSYEPVKLSGGNVMMAWRRPFSPTNDIQFRAYYDRTALLGPQLGQTRNTVDLDFVQRIGSVMRQDIRWGLGTHISASHFTQTVQTLDLEPREETDSIVSAFAQDEIALVPSRLSVTVGAKLEHNNFTGAEVQPSARVLWMPNDWQSVWFAATRAVRTPSQLETRLLLTRYLGGQIPTFLQIAGNTDFEAERLKGYEAGYRVVLGDRAFVEVSAFRNRHDRLQSFGAPSTEVRTSPLPAHLLFILPYANGVAGSSRGAELSGNWKASGWLQIKGSYSYLHVDVHNTLTAPDVLNVVRTYNGSSPDHQLRLQALLTLPRGWEVDQSWRRVSELPSRMVPEYTTVDARVGYRVTRTLDVSVAGQNLLQGHHPEFGHDPGPIVAIRRSVYVAATWRR